MKNQTITINQQPKTVEEFIKIRNEVAVTPYGGGAMFMLALKIYTENEELGRKCLIMSITLSRLNNYNDYYKGYDIAKTDLSRINSQLRQHPYLPKSYIEGSSPENAYKVELPYIMKLNSNPHSGNIADGKFKIYIKCSGADSMRPISLEKNNKGLWKVKEWSSAIVGIRKPVEIINDDL